MLQKREQVVGVWSYPFYVLALTTAPAASLVRQAYNIIRMAR